MILAFDLDDTLYSEHSFVLSGFKKVAHIIASSSGASEALVLQELISELHKNGRGKIFDSVLSNHHVFSQGLLEECIFEYQNHRPDIVLFPGALEVLGDNKNMPKYLVTDGNPITQNNKVDVLGIRIFFSEVFTTWSLGQEFAKPSLRVFQEILRRENSTFEKLVYVADDPNKDFVALNKAGAITVRVLTGRFSSLQPAVEFDAKFTIPDISQFDVSQYPS